VRYQTFATAAAVDLVTDAPTTFLTALAPAGDDDSDQLSNSDEINVHGTSPLDDDTDGDGLLDGAEVALGTSPTDPDEDDDGVCDGPNTVGGSCATAGPDNCPFVVNGSQTNSDAFPAGDDCQCGDVNGDGIVDADDHQVAAENLVGATLSGPFIAARCNVVGLPGPEDCDVEDLFVLERIGQALPVTLENSCAAYQGP
jgi:hypothetical protein